MRRDDSRIVVGLDSGETARAVLAVAQRFGTAIGAELAAVHVGRDLPRRLADLAATAGIHVAVEPGNPIDVLTRRLATPGVVAAVVGSRAAGGPCPAGHVSLGLVRHATVPVVVVPPGTRVGEEPLRDVLLPLDGTRETEAAAAPSVETLAGSGLRITVAHVFDAERVPRFLDQSHHGLDAWGQEFLARHAPPDLDLVLRAGRPGDQLLDVIAGTAPDLVVLGWSRDLSPGRARTIRQLLTDSSVPLLLVPTNDTDRSVEVPLIEAGRGPDW